MFLAPPPWLVFSFGPPPKLCGRVFTSPGVVVRPDLSISLDRRHREGNPVFRPEGFEIESSAEEKSTHRLQGLQIPAERAGADRLVVNLAA